MWEIVKSGGWLMLPIMLCSVVASGIIVERLWSLQRRRVAPRGLVNQVWQWARARQLTEARVNELRRSSPLGRVLAAGLVNLRHSRAVMQESIEDTGRHVVLELERFLNTLGTIAAIAPLLGLLGTVFGMIQVFYAIKDVGVGHYNVLAGGIAQALITTAAGLLVAIPSLMFYRYFRGRVDELVVAMEQEARAMVEVLHGERERERDDRTRG